MFDRAKGFFAAQSESAGLGSTGSDELRLAVALLLVSAAKSDGEFAESEYRLIRTAATDKLQLPPEKINALLKDGGADNQMLADAIAEINANFDPEQRVQILALVWSVVSADQIAGREESAFAAQLRHDLGLSIEQSMRARKLSEDIKVDGFKEFIEASQSMVDAAKSWFGKKEP